MIHKIEIENFKSVKKLELELGRVTVLIGANGAGKSNILEGIAFASAAAADKLDGEFLFSRGVRTSDYNFMFSAYDDKTKNKVLVFNITDENDQESYYDIRLASRDGVSWKINYVEQLKTGRKGVYANRLSMSEELLEFFIKRAEEDILIRSSKEGEHSKVDVSERKSLFTAGYLNRLYRAKNNPSKHSRPSYLQDFERFLIYAPENRELRTFAEEGQILPLGIRGEGLFRLLKILSQQDDGAKLAILKEKLQLIDWFEDFEFQQDAMAYERRLLIRDRHLSGDLAYFDQRSANEGFLFLLFYFCLFLSDATPPFFAIDNIDSSLNPKLCAQLVRELTQMAKDNGKQAILTTHNPAVLDGLDLTDPEQKLYVVRRNADGETIVSKVDAPRVEEGQEPVPLSEAFLRGYLGGLPTNF